MSSGGYLVLRRHGALWGVLEDTVTRIGQDEATTIVETAAGELVVDEVLGRAATVRVAPLGAYTSTLMTGTVAALGVHQGACLLVVDPTNPPGALRRAPPKAPPVSGSTGGGEGEHTHGTKER